MESRAEHVSPNIYGTEQLFGAQGIVELQFILVQGMVSQLFEGNLVTIHKHKPSWNTAANKYGYNLFATIDIK
jgi:hypothetical protein